MNTKRIPGFQWAMMIFIFFIIAYTAPIILKDFQSTISFKTFVFDLSSIAPFIAALICLIVFRHKKAQIGSLKLSIGLKVIERIILALVLPLIIFIISMVCFNVFADSFVLLQQEDLSVSIPTIIIGQLIMAFLIEFGFRSYLQHIVETKMNTFIASIIVGFMFAIWNINLTFSFEYTAYSFLYYFAFSMIIGELIRATKGRTIYIATIFHAMMSLGLVFLFNEELGEVFAMKVIALSTSAVAVVYLLITLILRTILYFFTKRSLDEVDENNYLDHVNETSENDAQTNDEGDKSHSQTQSAESTKSNVKEAGAGVGATQNKNRQTHDTHSPTSTQSLDNDIETRSSSSNTETDKQKHESTKSQHLNDENSTIHEDETRDTVQSNNDDNNSNNLTNNSVEASTEKVNHNSINSKEEPLKSNARYSTDRKSSAVSNAKASIANENQTEDTSRTSTKSNTTKATTKDDTQLNKNAKQKRTRSPFNLKSKRRHRR
ncbi:lysostaphin resistance A-like protein [Staphylococcus aureus]